MKGVAETPTIRLSNSTPLSTMSEGAFRKIDIDQYDEDVIQESELYDADPRDPAQVLDEAKQRQVAARNSQNK
jgi:hypothetical protein